MIILFGTRIVKSLEKNTRLSYCPQCSSVKAMGSYFARRWFHLFYIPIFPIQRKQYYLDVCPSCKRGKVMEEDNLTGVKQRLQEKTGLFLDQYIQNNGKFSDDKQENHNQILSLLINIENLVILNHWEGVNQWQERLSQAGYRGMAALIRSILLGRTRQWSAAMEELQESLSMGGVEYFSYYQLGSISMVTAKYIEASDFFSKAMEQVQDKLEALRETLTALFLGRQNQRYIELFEYHATSYPQFKTSKLFYNRYKVCCRRVKRPPQITP